MRWNNKYLSSGQHSHGYPIKKTTLFLYLIGFSLVSVAPFVGAETLEQAFNVAIENNHRIKAAKADTSVYDQQLYAAEGLRLPSVNLSSGYTQLSVTPAAKANFGGQTAQFPVSQDSYFKTQAMVSVPVYTSGMIAHNIGAAEAALEASKQNEVSSVLDLKMQVAEAYIAVLRAEGALQVVQSHVESMAAHSKDATNKFNQGIVARNDVLAATVEQANAQQKVVQVSNQIDIAQARYNQLLNRNLATPVKLSHQFPKQPQGMLKDLSDAALKQRPELSVLTQQIESLEQQAQSVSSGLLPQITANGGYQYEQNRYQVHEGMWMVNIGMQWKLFDGSTRHKSDAIVRQAIVLKERQDELASMIGLQVRQAWLDTQETQKRIDVAKQTIVQANENMQVSTDRYQQGLSVNTDLLKAEDLRMMAYDNLNNAQYDLALATLHLRYALGVL
jgi:outer membrane protein TolC